MGDDLHTLYEDEDLVAVNKPSGMLSEGGLGENDLEQLVSERVGKPAYCCHRLDRLTSGVLLLRKSGRWKAELARIFEERRVRKEYWALVEGVWDRRIQRIETRIDRLPEVGWANVASGGKPASTTAQVLGQRSDPDVAWLRLLLKTGRTHQARLHCLSAGCPILGDTRYGAKLDPEGAFGLHARRLSFQHPGTGQALDLLAGTPGEWAIWLQRMRPKRS